MIDKQKLLQWVEDERYVYSEPYDDTDTPDDIRVYKAKINTLRHLEIHIAAGSFDVEEVAHERSEASSPSAART